MFGQFTLDGGFKTILFIVLLLLIGIYSYVEISRLKKNMESLSQRFEKFAVSFAMQSDIYPVSSGGTNVTKADREVPIEVTNEPVQDIVMKDMVKENVVQDALNTDLSVFMKPSSPTDNVNLESEDKSDELSESEKRTELDDKDIKDMLDFISEKVDEVSPPLEQIIDIKEQSQSENASVSQPEPTLSETPDDTIKIITSQVSNIYESKTVSELKEILQERGLPLSGNKTKLIKRIMENDQSQK